MAYSRWKKLFKEPTIDPGGLLSYSSTYTVALAKISLLVHVERGLIINTSTNYFIMIKDLEILYFTSSDVDFQR